MNTSIYDYITEQESEFLMSVQITNNWPWNFQEHVRKSFLYFNSKFTSGDQDSRPFANIIRPILNLQFRAEGFDVKDIVLYINDKVNYFKSFLVKKYHQKWARENEIDTFIDKLVETWIVYGGVLVKKTSDKKPEVVPWQRIAFCDQTSIMSGPIAEKHYFSPDELKDYEKRGWYNVDEAIVLSKPEKTRQQVVSKTPGRYVEVYEVHGIFPLSWLYDRDEQGNYTGKYFSEDQDPSTYVQQVHICCAYDTKEGKKGITLYKAREKEVPYKFCPRDEIFGRALGFGGAEELFEAQIWANYSEIMKKELLDQASKIIYQTMDENLANKNNTVNMVSGQIVKTTDPNGLRQIDTFPRNLNLFENSFEKWQTQARTMGAANEAILGEPPTAGTPFKSVELQAMESHSLHEYRKGKLAIFVDEIYRDWIMPYISREITNGDEFLATLDLDEMQYVADNVVRNTVNNRVKEMVLSGELPEPEAVEELKRQTREDFARQGNKRFIQILKGELKNAPMSVEISIAGKQKNLVNYTDKLVNVFRTILTNPQILQSPPMAKLFNDIIESSGLTPVDFTGFSFIAPQPQASLAQTEPLQNVAQQPKLIPA